MNRKLIYLVVSCLFGVLVVAMAPAAAFSQTAPQEAAAIVGTAFTYQGFLESNGNPVSGSIDFEFKLYDDALVGAQIGSTLTIDDVFVADGVFNVELDFGTSAFGGGARWLEISVRPGASGGAYTLLSPRQAITPAPYALALPNVFTNEGINFVGVGRDFRISGNEVFGVRYVGDADQYGGMYVETAHANGWPFYGYATNGSFRAWTYYNGTTGDWSLYNAGIRLTVPNEGGLQIGPSADYSLVINNSPGSDGIRIYDTGDDGIQVGSDPDYPNYGLYIPSPGVSTYGLWPNTAEASGNWALYTVDNIEAGNVLANAYSLLAQVSGNEALAAGEIVAVAGLAEALPGGSTSLPAVQRAAGDQESGLVGVVASRMLWEPAPGKEAEGEMAMQSAEGAAQPGEYVSIVVLGVAQVKVDPQAAIVAGDRLVAAGMPGHARPLRTQLINDMLVAEGAQVIGVALAAPAPGQETIPVFVTLR